MFSILKPYIFSLDPETAHDLAIKSLKANFLPESFFSVKEEELLDTNLFKKKIKNPIGLAAGFDKSAEVYNSLFKLGFGFVEVGTITPKRQLGNPKPRIFRLEKDCAWVCATVERIPPPSSRIFDNGVSPNKCGTAIFENESIQILSKAFLLATSPFA